MMFTILEVYVDYPNPISVTHKDVPAKLITMAGNGPKRLMCDTLIIGMVS